ncbi:MAG: hypothetical protein GWO00_04860 [Gemmatimonadetes bacterium]|nr:hypothetical protein [Gemmatimonadota bacterium]NIV57005.1 hypothetical protein [Actinomycetota bacterium]NIP81266.1 hypothetical protein [Gemmatimonadota bacterium]NIR77728.1 hypothetical protein [Gemmatimonadota bacterium]NIU30098.1 hypothetical protein [Gemmatimonadota bacterium]
MIVEARLATDEFAGIGPLSSVLGALPDTVDVDLRGRLDSTPGRLIFTVERARAAKVSLPHGVVAAVAAALARQSGDRILSPDGETAALGLRWPDGVAYVTVLGDRLVLARGERIGSRAVDGSVP